MGTGLTPVLSTRLPGRRSFFPMAAIGRASGVYGVCTDLQSARWLPVPFELLLFRRRLDCGGGRLTSSCTPDHSAGCPRTAQARPPRRAGGSAGRARGLASTHVHRRPSGWRGRGVPAGAQAGVRRMHRCTFIQRALSCKHPPCKGLRVSPMQRPDAPRAGSSVPKGLGGCSDGRVSEFL